MRLIPTVLVLLVLTGDAPRAVAQSTGTFSSIAIGTATTGEKIHVEGGNALINSPNEQALRFRRFGSAADSPFRDGPTFNLGRIVIGGDGSPNFRVIYSDNSSERTVLSWDDKGIVASVKNGIRGSHFEGFLRDGDREPVFRLNSFPYMALELGDGGFTPTDVRLQRCGPRCLDVGATILSDDSIIRSSRALNDDVAPLPQSEALRAFRMLAPVAFVRKSDPHRTRQLGFVAEDLPELVRVAEQDGVSTGQILALLVNVVQHQNERIAALEEQLGGEGKLQW